MKRLRTKDLRDALPPDVRLPRRLRFEDVVEMVMFTITLLLAWLVLLLLYPEGSR